MQSMAIYYWLHIYFFTTAHTTLIFFLLQIVLKLFWGLITYSFVENFKRYLLIIKRDFITLIIDEKS